MSIPPNGAVYPSHKLTSSSSTEQCVPTIDQANTCIVVKGETSILLDNNSDATFLTGLALEAIEEGLSDRTFLEGFTDDIIWAALIYSGHASLVESSDHNGDNGNGEDDPNVSPITATVAVAAASVSIVVASIFCYGFMRRPPSDDPSVRHRYRKSSPRTVMSISNGDMGIPTRRHFVRLEDLSSSPTSFITASISLHTANLMNIIGMTSLKKITLQLSLGAFLILLPTLHHFVQEFRVRPVCWRGSKRRLKKRKKVSKASKA